jgi:hypothetical protein
MGSTVNTGEGAPTGSGPEGCHPGSKGIVVGWLWVHSAIVTPLIAVVIAAEELSAGDVAAPELLDPVAVIVIDSVELPAKEVVGTVSIWSTTGA